MSQKETLTRYLFSKSEFSNYSSDNPQLVRIKPCALAPIINKNTGSLETSVFCTTEYTPKKVIEVGVGYVAAARQKELIASVSFSAELVSKVELRVDPDGIGHADHCNIVDWPPTKQDWLEKSRDLADSITAHESKIFIKQ